MSFELPKLNSLDSLQKADKVVEFEQIGTPEELASFMGDNIRYGFVSKNSGQVYSPDNPEMEANFKQEYYLQTVEELLASQHGVCWDSVELEREWFIKHGFNPKTYFLMFAKEEGTDLPTHTFLAYKKNDKWYWFEHSFHDFKGIHEYDTEKDLIDDVKKKHFEYAVKYKDAKPEDFSTLRISEYDNPGYGSSPQEFTAKIFEKNPQLVYKEPPQ